MFHLIAVGNQLAYGELGMPPWVQLDCATLPGAMVGFALPREKLPFHLTARLAATVRARFGEDAAKALDDYEGPWPVSEYCAAPTFVEGTVVGFSFFSLVRGLGVPSKALALRCYGAREQIGSAQYSNPSLRGHTAFGPLELIPPRVQAHSRPNDTFVYRLRVDQDHLEAVIARGIHAAEPQDADALVPIGPDTALRVEELSRSGPLAIAAPGHLTRAGETFVTLRRLPRNGYRSARSRLAGDWSTKPPWTRTSRWRWWARRAWSGVSCSPSWPSANTLRSTCWRSGVSAPRAKRCPTATRRSSSRSRRRTAFAG